MHSVDVAIVLKYGLASLLPFVSAGWATARAELASAIKSQLYTHPCLAKTGKDQSRGLRTTEEYKEMKHCELPMLYRQVSMDIIHENIRDCKQLEFEKTFTIGFSGSRIRPVYSLYHSTTTEIILGLHERRDTSDIASRAWMSFHLANKANR